MGLPERIQQKIKVFSNLLIRLVRDAVLPSLYLVLEKRKGAGKKDNIQEGTDNNPADGMRIEIDIVMTYVHWF